MKLTNDIRELFQKAAVDTHPKMDETVQERVLATHEATTTNDSTSNRSNVRRTIMSNPITKLAIAAAVVVAALSAISQFGGSAAGVAWGEVARKVHASRSVIFRQMKDRSDSEYSMNYLSATQSRKDIYEGGEIIVSHYLDLERMTGSSVYHTQKHYWRDAPLTERNAQAHDELSDPKHLVGSILSCNHTELGRETIEGVLCEGLETTDPAVLGEAMRRAGAEAAVSMQLWVSVETNYPILCQGHVTVGRDAEARNSEWVLDQFEWDAELDPSVFEPNIPADYEEI